MLKKTIKKFSEIRFQPFHIFLALLVIVIVVVAYIYAGEAKWALDVDSSGEVGSTLTLPFFWWELDFRAMGLGLASFFIGLLDGFNPCAMWVLIYLITLAANMDDRRKMIYVVGTFLLSSGILYFVILTLWLLGWDLGNAFGVGQWLLYIVGGFAIFTGIIAIRDFIEKGGHVTCEVGDFEQRKKTMTRIRDVIHSPITIASVIATIILAFAVNSIEFICSAGLPAMFTSLLSTADLPMGMDYLYITIYTLAFMLDDIIIFTLALLAINSDVMNKYSGLSKIIGGVIMIAIGVILLFFPELI